MWTIWTFYRNWSTSILHGTPASTGRCRTCGYLQVHFGSLISSCTTGEQIWAIFLQEKTHTTLQVWQKSKCVFKRITYLLKSSEKVKRKHYTYILSVILECAYWHKFQKTWWEFLILDQTWQKMFCQIVFDIICIPALSQDC